MKEALTLALETLESSRVFVMSREMIKQPEGADWYDNRITAIKEALAQPERDPWREAVEDELVTTHIFNASHSDPRKAVKNAIDWHVQAALDPQVSSDAAALIDRGMKQERALWELSKLGQEIEAQPEQEPVDFASLLREAEEIVQSKPTWKRFIEGTPLANDIAVWMAVFAQDVARRSSPPQRQPEERNFCSRCGKRTADIHTCTPPHPEREPAAWLTAERYAQLHTAQRPWVGLTKEEIDSALCKYASWYNFAAHLDNILKEKNR